MPKSITDIIPPSRRKQMDMDTPPPPPPPQAYSGGSERIPVGRRRRFPFKYVFAALAVVVICAVVLMAFGGARVEVTPVAKAVTVASDFSATPGAGDLPYQTVTIDKTVSKELKASGTETVNIPAQGTVTIYNAQSKVQELINNTRFQTPDGLIFRIHESLKVPGGTPSVPGSLKATVYADAGGNKYNIGPSTFTLPGLKNSPVYDLVYARSTEGMTGGFSGTRAAIAQADRDTAYASMKTSLETDLRGDIGKHIPDGYVLVPGSVFLSYTAQPDAAGKNDTVTVAQKGSAVAVVFPSDGLAKAVAFKTLGVYTGEPVTLLSVDKLTLTPKDATGAPGGSDTFAFTLSGATTVVSTVHPADIAGAIAGKSREAAKTILGSFSELQSAKLILKPFWAGTLPADPGKIQVVVLPPKPAQ